MTKGGILHDNNYGEEDILNNNDYDERGYSAR